jgi:ATP-dependent DNA helicase RecG
MKETETREFKRSLAELKAGIVSMAAILNKHGVGQLWFGIRADGKAVGQDVTEKTLRDVSQAIAAHIEPRIYPHVTLEELDSASCIKIEFEGGESPYYAYGRGYMRVADEDRQLSAKEIEKLVLSKHIEHLRWDNSVAQTTVAELDADKLKRFVQHAGLEWDIPENALEKLGLIKKGKVLNAASLFFADEPMELRCAVFGTTTSSMIIDRHDTRGDILELIEEAQKYVLKNIHIGMRLEGLYRKDVPEIATEALREAIINAFCHRDYRDPDYVQVAVYKDRVEIRNPGGLFGGITIADLRKGHISKRRNPLIADLFRRIEMVEAWGRGMPLILKYEPDVEFKEIAGIFIAAFGRPSFFEADAERTATRTGASKGLVEGLAETRAEARAETPVKTRVKTPERILEQFRNNPQLALADVAKAIGKSTSAVERACAKLVQQGILKHVGPRKGGHWEVLK